MKNPIINRLGFNIFWDQYWNSLKKYNLILYQNKIFYDLLKTFLIFGLKTRELFNFNSRWGLKSYLKIKFLKYYRKVTLFNNVMKTTSNYYFRLESNIKYKSRFVIFRYNSWVILVLQWVETKLYKTILKGSTSLTKFNLKPHFIKSLQRLITFRVQTTILKLRRPQLYQF